MALQVWLPLNNLNIHNQGVSGEVTVNGTPTIDNNGKVGKCVKLDLSIATTITPNLGSDCISMGGWFKFNKDEIGTVLNAKSYNSTYSTATGNLIGNDSFGGIGLIWRSNTMYNSTFSSITVMAALRTSSIGALGTNAYTLPFDLWVHIFLIFNRSTLLLYINGLLFHSRNVSSFSDSVNRVLSINLAAVYGGNALSTSIPMYVNDIRYYNHALSLKEFHEVTKCLVLHYPLNDTLVLTNAFNYPTFNTSAASGGWSHWGPSGYSATYSLNTDKQFIYNKIQTYSHKVSNTGSTYYICHQSPAFDGGYRSAQAIIKMSDGSDPTGKVGFRHNANVGTNPPNTFHHLGDGFYLMKHEGFQLTGSDDLVCVYVYAGYTVYISEAYLENNRTVCSDLFQGNIVYDESGYGNNGTITGTLTNSTDTPRYDKCSQGNGNISCSGLTINNPFTISTWIYLPITGTTGSGSELTIGPVNLYKDHDGVDKHTFSVTKSDNSPAYLTTFYPPEDKWYHLAIVSNGSTLKIYKNGVASTNNISTKDGKTNFSIMLSNNIKLSDLRLYATALSTDDIKALYQEAAFIDHKGNVGCYLFYEDADSQITKTGQIRTEEFEEISDLSDGVAKVYEQKIECNQLIEI